MANPIVNGILTGGLRLLETLDPAPTHLGRPLAAAVRQRNRRADPVVLVSGFANSPNSFRRYAASLARDGFRVYVVDLPGRGLADMREALVHVRRAIEAIRRASAAQRLDLVGFSEGGILARMYAETDAQAAQAVDSIVTIATPHNGADGWVAALASVGRALPGAGALLPASVGQLVHGASLVGSRRASGVRYASIYTRATDGMVSARAAELAGAVNVELPFGLRNSHYGVLHWSHDAYEAVRSLLSRQTS